MAKPLGKRVARGGAPLATGIAQTERLVLVVFGAATAFAGFLLVLVADVLPALVRYGIGLPVVAVGAGLAVLAVRVESGTVSSDVSPQTLLLSERILLSFLAFAALFCTALLVVSGPIPILLRLPMLLMTVLLGAGFAAAAVANRLPERTPTPVRNLQNTDD